MAGREIVPYGVDLNKKSDTLALSIVPLQEIAPVSSQSYFAQAIHCLEIASSSPCLLLQDKPCHPKAPKLIKVPKEINLFPPRSNEMLMGVKTNKFGDVTYAKYESVMPHVVIDGVRAVLEQV